MTGAPACVPNITERGRRRRLRGGIAWLVIGVAAAAGLFVARVGPPAFIILIIPFTMGTLGWLQARAKT